MTIHQREMKKNKELIKKARTLKTASKLLEDNQSFEIEIENGAMSYIQSNDGTAGILAKVTPQGNFIVVNGKWVKW